MIKKTLNTIKKSPSLFVIYAIWTVIIAAFYFIDMKSIHINGQSMLPTLLYGHGKKVLYSVFLYAPLIYYIYLAATDTVRKGWYFQGIKRGWWKYLLVSILYFWLSSFAHLLVVYLLPWEILTAPFLIEADFLAFWLVRVLLGSIIYFVSVPLIAEEKFSKGLKNIFKVGSKFFWKFFGMYALLQLFILVAPQINSYNGSLSLLSVLALIYHALINPAVSIFLYTYFITLYVNHRKEVDEPDLVSVGSEKVMNL